MDKCEINYDIAYLKGIVPIMKKLGVAKYNGIELAPESYSEMLTKLKELLPSIMSASLGNYGATPAPPPKRSGKKVIPIFSGLDLTPPPRRKKK